MRATSARYDALDKIRRACAKRGLELHVCSSHPTPKRPMHNGPVDRLEIDVSDPRDMGWWVYRQWDAGAHHTVVAFLKAALAQIHRKWPRPVGGPNATHANRQAKRARIEAAQRGARRSA